MLLKNINQKRVGKSHKIIWEVEGKEITTSDKVNAIYKIEDLKTKEFYIGSTDRLLARFLQHKSKLSGIVELNY